MTNNLNAPDFSYLKLSTNEGKFRITVSNQEPLSNTDQYLAVSCAVKRPFNAIKVLPALLADHEGSNPSFSMDSESDEPYATFMASDEHAIEIFNTITQLAISAENASQPPQILLSLFDDFFEKNATIQKILNAVESSKGSAQFLLSPNQTRSNTFNIKLQSTLQSLAIHRASNHIYEEEGHHCISVALLPEWKETIDLLKFFSEANIEFASYLYAEILRHCIYLTLTQRENSISRADIEAAFEKMLDLLFSVKNEIPIAAIDLLEIYLQIPEDHHGFESVSSTITALATEYQEALTQEGFPESGIKPLYNLTLTVLGSKKEPLVFDVINKKTITELSKYEKSHNFPNKVQTLASHRYPSLISKISYKNKLRILAALAVVGLYVWNKEILIIAGFLFLIKILFFRKRKDEK